MHPAIAEALVLAVMGISGIAGGLLLGVRRVIPLAVIGFGFAVALRSLSAFASWSLARPDLSYEFWLGTSVVVAVVGAAVCWRDWRAGVSALGLFAGLSVSALATKYVFDIGERHHSDSADTVALALVQIQSENSNIAELANSPKRGIAYPLMLALGPEGRILGGFTPLVFLTTIALSAWLVWELVGSKSHRAAFAISALAIGAYSLTVPMWRASMTYLNGHTLMGLAMVMLLASLLLYQRDGAFGALPAALAGVGGVVGATARAEGIVIVLLAVAALVSQRGLSTRADRIRLASALIVTGLSVTWWFGSLDSPVLDRFGTAEWLLVVASVLGAVLAAAPVIDAVRRWILPVAGVVLVALLLRVVVSSGDPLGMVLSQWPNLGLGAGGWATAAHVFIGSLLLLGWRAQSESYRTSMALTWLVIGGVLFSKTFDGGFGGAGFYDSVNRMWLHVAQLVLVTTALGYTTLISRILTSSKKKGEGSLSAVGSPQ